MTPIFFAWVAAIAYGLEGVIGKFSSKYSVKNPWLFNFFWELFILILLVPFAFHYGVGVPIAWSNILWGALCFAITSITYIYMLYLFDASVAGSLFNLRTAIVPLLGIFLLSEVLTTAQIVFIGLIFIGGIFVTLDEKMSFRTFFRPAMLIAIVSVLFSALLGMFTKLSIAENGYWTATIWIALIAQGMLLLTLPLFVKDLKTTPAKSYLSVLIMSVFGALGYWAQNLAYADNISISGAIMALPFSMLFTIILSRLAPQLLEHHTWKVYAIRLAAAAIMFFAAIKLS